MRFSLFQHNHINRKFLLVTISICSLLFSSCGPYLRVKVDQYQGDLLLAKPAQLARLQAYNEAALREVYQRLSTILRVVNHHEGALIILRGQISENNTPSGIPKHLYVDINTLKDDNEDVKAKAKSLIRYYEEQKHRLVLSARVLLDTFISVNIWPDPKKQDCSDLNKEIRTFLNKKADFSKYAQIQEYLRITMESTIKEWRGPKKIKETCDPITDNCTIQRAQEIAELMQIAQRRIESIDPLAREWISTMHRYHRQRVVVNRLRSENSDSFNQDAQSLRNAHHQMELLHQYRSHVRELSKPLGIHPLLHDDARQNRFFGNTNKLDNIKILDAEQRLNGLYYNEAFYQTWLSLEDLYPRMAGLASFLQKIHGSKEGTADSDKVLEERVRLGLDKAEGKLIDDLTTLSVHSSNLAAKQAAEQANKTLSTAQKTYNRNQPKVLLKGIHDAFIQRMTKIGLGVKYEEQIKQGNDIIEKMPDSNKTSDWYPALQKHIYKCLPRLRQSPKWLVIDRRKDAIDLISTFTIHTETNKAKREQLAKSLIMDPGIKEDFKDVPAHLRKQYWMDPKSHPFIADFLELLTSSGEEKINRFHTELDTYRPAFNEKATHELYVVCKLTKDGQEITEPISILLDEVLDKESSKTSVIQGVTVKSVPKGNVCTINFSVNDANTVEVIDHYFAQYLAKDAAAMALAQIVNEHAGKLTQGKNAAEAAKQALNSHDVGTSDATQNPAISRINKTEQALNRLDRLRSRVAPIQTTGAYLALEELSARVSSQGRPGGDNFNEWQTVSDVLAEGYGNGDYMVMRDHIGNWQVKSMKLDPSALIDAYYGGALAALDLATRSGNLSANLRNKVQAMIQTHDTGKDATAATAAVIDVVSKDLDALIKQHNETIKAKSDALSQAKNDENAKPNAVEQMQTDLNSSIQSAKKSIEEYRIVLRKLREGLLTVGNKP